MCLVPSFPTNILAVSPNSANVVLPDPTVTVNGSSNIADIQITAHGGTVSVNTTGVTITVGDGTDDQAITINGDNSALQTALATLTFTPTSGLVGEEEAHVQLSSSGASNSRLEIILINAPFITLPSAPNVAEDASNVPFGSALNIDDATGDNQNVILTVTGGTFSIGNHAGLSYSVGNGFANTTATFSGSLVDVNNALDTLVFTPKSNLNGTGVASLRVQSDDGNGGTDDETLTFDVAAVNDAPAVTLPSAPSVAEDAINVAFGSTLGITDVEGDNQTVTLTAAGGVLSIGNGAGLTYSVGNGFANTTTTFSGTLTDVNNALDTLVFTPTSNLNGIRVASLRVQSGDGNGGTDDETLTFDVTAVNDAPAVTLPSAPNVAEDASNVPFGSALGITDVEGDNQTVTLTVAGGVLSIGNGAGLTYSVGNGFANTTTTFSGTLTDVNNALDTLVFTPTSNLSGTNAGSLRVQSNDGNGGTDDETLTFNITAVNDAPVIRLPSVPTVNEDATSVAVLNPGFPNTLLNITDVENDIITATVTATGGTYSYTSTGGVTFNSGGFAGPNTTSQITGVIAAVTNAIQSIRYMPTANLNGTGAGSIRLQVSDGNGGTDDETLTFDITSVNDAPTASDSTVTMNEDTSRTFTTADFNFADVDTGDALQSVRLDTITANSGVLLLSGTAPTEGQVITVADLNGGALVYTPAANANGAGLLSLTFSVNDGTAFAAGPSTLIVNVTDVAEPVVVTPTPTDTGTGTTPTEPPAPVVVNRDNTDTTPDTVEGTAADDIVQAGGGNDTVSGGAGSDNVDGGSGNDTVDGGEGDDTLVGGDGDDSISGGDGQDTTFAGQGDTGNDTVDGGAGNDVVGAGAGNDRIDAGSGADIAFASAGEDFIDGGEGNDTLFGGAGDDTVLGGAGDDDIWAGEGNDQLTGGEGADTFIFGAKSGNDTVADFDVTEDVINLSFAPAGFATLDDVVAAATSVTQNGETGLLLDLGGDQSVFIVGIGVDNLTTSNVTI